MIKTKDIVHLYIGCKFIYQDRPPTGEWYKGGTICTVSDYGFIMGQNGKWNNIPEDVMEIENWGEGVYFKLILTHQSDMTKQQKKEYKELCHYVYDNSDKVVRISDTPESLLYLFKNGIDAFDLIENGEAIDRNAK